MLDFLVDDRGGRVGVPALWGSEGCEVGGVRVEDEGPCGGAGVRGVGRVEEDGGPEERVLGALDVPDGGGGPDLWGC